MSVASRLEPLAFRSSSPPLAPRVVAILGLAWNLFGTFKFLETLRSTPQSLIEMGMTPAQASVYASYPAWMTAAFGIGVAGGLLGSGALLARSRAAVPIFAVSFVSYVVLYLGDITEGVFAALGLPQVAVLTTVIVIAGGLLTYARHLQRQRSSPSS